MKKNILLIGASRGLGKGIYDYYKNENYNVFLSVRKTMTNLKKNTANIIKIDLEKTDTFKKINIKTEIKFSLIFFNAAIIPNSRDINEKKCWFKNLEYSQFEKIMKVNCYSQIKLFETLYKKNHIAKNAKIIFVSSRAGSIKLRGTLKHHKTGGNLIYRISKSSLNAAVRNIAFDLRNKNITIVSLDPGWVNTTKLKEQKDLISVNESVNNIVKTVKKIEKKHHGKFLNLYGKEVPW